MSEHQDITHAARMLCVPEARVERELARAIRRSEPDAREVYGVILGVRFVGRRERIDAPWWVTLERRPLLWDRHPLTGWSG